MADRKTSELDDRDLENVQGGLTAQIDGIKAEDKGLLGDDLGVLRGKDKKPGKDMRPEDKQMERVHEDE